ncbi:mediator of RNA polymerase II transcription subunit 17-like [Diadema antillarum]|uniref:mediator of RNA polymerase II transcription subunit 17-like n=1 Tax=Diadema antillarum TaxID=105358 RepID=UPI003A8A4AE5
MAGPSVKLSLESLQEHKVQEISLDGLETYTKPLSMSENLAKLAHKINFATKTGDKESQESATSEAEEKEAVAPFQQPQWPWESVRNKVRAALTEMSVLSDVIHIARLANKEHPYMVLDPVSVDNTPSKQYNLQIVEKKKSLEAAGNILMSGASRMIRSKHFGSPEKRSAKDDFFGELHRLRMHWRLKRIGSNILGDLSFKTAGSRFWHSGTFEVAKSTEQEIEEAEQKGIMPCALRVTVPSDLSGTSYIQVLIQEGEAEIATALVEHSSRSHVSADAHWQERLEAAQNVLFCKELFAQIAREAVQLKAAIPHLVVGNQIIAHIFQGVQLCITLCHDTNMDRRRILSSSMEATVKPNHSHALEHSLHQLLRELHRSNLNGATPRPITMSHSAAAKRRRTLALQAAGHKEIAQTQQTECLLEKIMKQAKHIVLRQRVARLLDTMSAEHQDPSIHAHWGAMTRPLQSTVKVHITSSGFIYEQLVRSSVQLSIETDSIQAVWKDGRVVTLTHNEQELRDFIMLSLSQHQVIILQQLCKYMSMQILQYNLHVGTGPAPLLGSASAIMFTTPNGQKTVAVRSDPLEGVTVMVQGCKSSSTHHQQQEVLGDVVTDSKWENLPKGYREVDMARLPGRNFIHKMEMLMATLAK